MDGPQGGDPTQLLADALTQLQSRRHITSLLDFYTFPWPCFVQCAEKYELETKNKKKKIFMNFHQFFNQSDTK